MKSPRQWIFALGIVALLALFLKMPATPYLFGFFTCKTCVANDPYFPLVGAGYFAVLIALSLLFPRFPSPMFARSGLVWSVFLAGALTAIDWPGVCVACLIGHACHILMWIVWSMTKPVTQKLSPTPVGERLFLTLFAPISVVALFGCLNLTFLVYQLQAKQHQMAASLQVGDVVPPFAIETSHSLFTNKDIAATTIVNFVTPNCPYCQDQLPILDAFAATLTNTPHRFINISNHLSPELTQLSSSIEWVEDKEGSLRELFKVAGYPTLFVIGSDNTIKKVIPGVPQHLHADLLSQ